MKLECADCGALYPGDFKQHWGKTQETTGYGPVVKCVALVPSEAAKAAADREQRKVNPAVDPHEVCGGTLGAVADDPSDAARLVQLSAIQPTQR